MTSKVLRENWPPKHNNLTFCINSGSIPDQGQNCKSIGKIKDLAIPTYQKSSKRSQNHEFYGISFLPKKTRKRFRINSGSRSKLQKYRENQRPCNPNIPEIVQKVPKSWILRNFLFTKKSRKRFRINSGSRSKLQKYRENQRPCNPNTSEIVQKVPKSWILWNFLFTKKITETIPDRFRIKVKIAKV